MIVNIKVLGTIEVPDGMTDDEIVMSLMEKESVRSEFFDGASWEVNKADDPEND